jgi:hypothetical protein
LPSHVFFQHLICIVPIEAHTRSARGTNPHIARGLVRMPPDQISLPVPMASAIEKGKENGLRQ